MVRPAFAHRVVVVGAGVAGLVAALQLACRGVDVTVIERAKTCGGKMRQVCVDGALVDSGPTVFTMRWVFDKIFVDAGASLDEYLQLEPLQVLARHAWSDTERLDLYADQQQSAQAIGQFSGAAEAKRFLKFCYQAKRVYETLEQPYICSQKQSAFSLTRALGPHGVRVLLGLGAFSTLWQALSRQFQDPRLAQLFGRYATYTGSSPWAAPSTLMLIAQVEMDGVCAVKGGMHALAQALERLARERGARFRFGEHVEEIVVRDGRTAAVRLASGDVVNADSIVYNGDAGALYQSLMGDGVSRAAAALPTEARSLSALTWSIHAKTQGFDLTRHNVFFQSDYASEFEDIFTRRRLPSRPTVYVCAQDRDDRRGSVEGAERILCLVNAPALGDVKPLTAEEINQCEQASFALLSRCGLKIDRQSHNSVLTTPADFNRLYPGTGGALYGRALNGWMDTFKRPAAKTSIPGLYLAGGGAHPGPGVPMAALSGSMAADALMAHLDSISRSRAAGTSGGTSMHSAKMGSTA
jgi:1-hydroxycarotenoid 3,4-desaturase